MVKKVRKTRKVRQGFSFYWWILGLYAAPGKRYLVWQGFHAIFAGLEPVAVVYVTAKFVAEVARVITAANGQQSQAVFWLWMLALILLLSRIVYGIDQLIQTKYKNAIEVILDTEMFAKMYALSQEQFDNEAFNAQLSKATQGMFSSRSFLNNVTSLISAVFRFISAMLVITATAPIVGLIIVSTLIPLLIVEFKANNRRQKDMEASDRDWRITARTRWILQDPTRMPEIRLLGCYGKLVDIWKLHNRKVFSREMETDRKTLTARTITDVLDNAGHVLANLWFLRLAVQGSLTLDRFLFLRGLLDETTSAGNMMVTSLQGMHEASLNFANLKAVLETKPAITDGQTRLEAPEGLSISFDNVSFRYPDSDKDVLKNINFSIAADEKVALVGENGAGKSTIIKLLLRQYLPTQGEIRVNGVPIAQLQIASYYQHISTLVQDFSLIEHLTIKENIAFGATNVKVDDQAIKAAATLAGADGFIEKLPHGYDQRLLNTFEDGSEVSGGQVQRLGIARALIRDSALLILDEPTSAIDAKAEYTIFKNIYEAHEGKATIIISHRFSTVRKANHIIVLDEGSIVEQGTHEQLITNDNLYKDLFDKQAEGYR